MKKRTLWQLFFAAAALLSSHLTTAQIYNAITPDQVAGTFTGPPPMVNIGNAVVHFGTGEMKVFVWDGGSPQLAWEHAGSKGSIPIAGASAGLGTVYDPDVVLNPSVGPPAVLIT